MEGGLLYQSLGYCGTWVTCGQPGARGTVTWVTCGQPGARGTVTWVTCGQPGAPQYSWYCRKYSIKLDPLSPSRKLLIDYAGSPLCVGTQCSWYWRKSHTESFSYLIFIAISVGINGVICFVTNGIDVLIQTFHHPSTLLSQCV